MSGASLYSQSPVLFKTAVPIFLRKLKLGVVAFVYPSGGVGFTDPVLHFLNRDFGDIDKWRR